MVVVLRCRDIESTRVFYESAGLSFALEQHGTGPVHYAHVDGAFVLELYPAQDIDGKRAGEITLMIDSSGAPPATKSVSVRDPDGRAVVLRAVSGERVPS